MDLVVLNGQLQQLSLVGGEDQDVDPGLSEQVESAEANLEVYLHRILEFRGHVAFVNRLDSLLKQLVELVLDADFNHFVDPYLQLIVVVHHLEDQQVLGVVSYDAVKLVGKASV